MTDFAEEQKNEIEALESIYPEEFEIISTKPYHNFTLTVSSQSTREDVENATCVLQFTYTARYPDEPPTMEVTPVENIEEYQAEQLLELMKELAQENLSMVMVFIIFSAVQEKLTVIVEQLAEEVLAEKMRREQAVAEVERKKFEGTRVTIETFLTWQTAFDAEMAEIKRLKAKEDTSVKKLTGIELFMLDPAMNDSDVKFLEEGGEVVEVDESLFDDIDVLALDDDDVEDDDNS